MTPTFFEELKAYVGFTEDSSAALRRLHSLTQASFASIVDDFYAAIDAHPQARATITGGAAQVDRLKVTLMSWIERMLLGPHDEAYYQIRARIGRVHVHIGLPQHYMFTAMARIRVRLFEDLQVHAQDRDEARRLGTALNQIMDLELAIMLETYREDLVLKNRNAERLATVGQLAANIGHELRNPLGVVGSSLYLVRQHLGPEAANMPQVAKHLDRIEVEIRRANQTIADLLDLARNKPPKRQRVPLQSLVDGAADASHLPVAVKFESRVPGDLTVDVDPGQFRRVLENLYTNACQAMEGHGHLSVECEANLDGGIRLRVRDDGPGVSAEDRPRIFQALFTTKAKGHGLGLALCQSIMESHGGTIALEATPSGASFLVTLPPPPR